MDEHAVARESEEQVPEGPAKRSLRSIVDNVLMMQVEVKKHEQELAAARARLRELEEQTLPDAMAAIGGAEEFRFGDGTKVKVANEVVGAFPKEEPQRQEALDYLVEEDGGELFKTNVSVSFGRSAHNAALDLAQTLREKGYEVEVVSGVHHQSLTAFAREALRNGRDLALDKLGLMRIRRAKVTTTR